MTKETIVEALEEMGYTDITEETDDAHATYFSAMDGARKMDIKVEHENHRVSDRYAGDEDWDIVGDIESDDDEEDEDE